MNMLVHRLFNLHIWDVIDKSKFARYENEYDKIPIHETLSIVARCNICGDFKFIKRKLD